MDTVQFFVLCSTFSCFLVFSSTIASDIKLEIKHKDYIKKHAEIFGMLPLVLQTACEQKSTSPRVKDMLKEIDEGRSNAQVLEGLEHTIKANVKFICSCAYLSPQTTKCVADACMNIVNGTPIDPTAFTYSGDREMLLKGDVLSKFPPLIQIVCLDVLQGKYGAQRLIEDVYALSQKQDAGDQWGMQYYHRQIRYDIKKICNEIRISPQTKALLYKACANIDSPSFDFSLNRYDPILEEANNIALIQCMPTVIRDICIKVPSEPVHYALAKAVFRGEDCFKHGNYRVKLGALLHERQYSPQTVVRLFQEFDDVLRGATVEEHPLNGKEETENKDLLVAQFSPRLKEVYSRDVYCGYRLLCQAYILSHPQASNIFFKHFVHFLSITDKNDWASNGRKHIRFTLKCLRLNRSLVKAEANNFISTFDRDKVLILSKPSLIDSAQQQQDVDPGTLCSVCYAQPTQQEQIATSCKHMLCCTCYARLEVLDQLRCPLCRGDI